MTDKRLEPERRAIVDRRIGERRRQPTRWTGFERLSDRDRRRAFRRSAEERRASE